jgi:hypothetical protein
VGLVNDCNEITKGFNQEEGPLQNISENMAINMKLLAKAMKGKDDDVSERVFMSLISL